VATRRPLVIVSGAVQELPTGDTLPGGAGVPAGGTTGQLLAKTSGTDFDTQWVSPQITVSSTAPGSPVLNQLWLDIT
jgi:hypothetical protein